MTTTRLQTMTRLFMATISVAAVAVALVAAPAAGAAGLRNCVDVTGPQANRAGCYEDVWADGAQYRMTFSNTRFAGATPTAIDPFYVLAPQTDQPQGAPPNTFPHDHVVRSVPARNDGQYSVRMQGSSSCAAARASSAAPAPRPGPRSAGIRFRSRSPSTAGHSRPPTRSRRLPPPATSH